MCYGLRVEKKRAIKTLLTLAVSCAQKLCQDTHTQVFNLWPIDVSTIILHEIFIFRWLKSCSTSIKILLSIWSNISKNSQREIFVIVLWCVSSIQRDISCVYRIDWQKIENLSVCIRSSVFRQPSTFKFSHNGRAQSEKIHLLLLLLSMCRFARMLGPVDFIIIIRMTLQCVHCTIHLVFRIRTSHLNLNAAKISNSVDCGETNVDLVLT